MKPTRRTITAALFGIGLSLGAAGLVNAAADTDTTATTSDTTVVATDDTSTATTATDDVADDADVPEGPHTANGITEEVLTGDASASVEAAVVAAYPDATILRVETDAEGAAFEAHVTLADGSDATVKLDASFAITATEAGGDGHHGGRGGHGNGGPHNANGITEVELTGDEATSVEAAVTAAYPDATIERMETDAEGAAFEAHITLADGSHATVKLDASFAVTGTETPND